MELGGLGRGQATNMSALTGFVLRLGDFVLKVCFTTSLIPAFSPRRRGNVRRVFEMLSGGIGRMVKRIT